MNDSQAATQLLAGKSIVVTRARHQAAGLEDVIRQFGAVPIAYPCIAIAPPGDMSALDHCLRSLHEYDWLALSSGNAARAVADRARALGVLPALKRIRIAVLGPATEVELRQQLGRSADFIPNAYSGESLAREIPIRERSRILLPQSDLADDSTAEIMRSRGAELASVVAYRTLVGSGGADVPLLLANEQIDALSFASPSAARFFRLRCKAPAALDLPALCLGERTASAAASEGFECLITPATFGLGAMILAFAEYSAERDQAAAASCSHPKTRDSLKSTMLH